MAVSPESFKLMRELELKIDEMLLSQLQGCEDQELKLTLSDTTIPSDVQKALTATYIKAGWKQAFFEANGLIFVLNKGQDRKTNIDR